MNAGIRLRPLAAVCAVGCAAGLGLTLWMRWGPPNSINIYNPRPQGTLNFCRDVAPIVYEHCGGCHRPGESAPFSLMDYGECRQRASQIADVVTRKLMPPWLPDTTLVEYTDQRGLTIDQIGIIRQWAEEGAIEGKPTDLPPPPRWVDGWRLGEPDLVVDMPEEFTLPAEGTDVFRNFVIPVKVDNPKYVRAAEIRPGNAKIVHHGVLLIDSTHESRRLDAQDEPPGYGGMIYGSTAHSPDGHFMGWTPGKMPFVAPEGMAWRLDPGTDLVLQLHMLPTGKPETIRARIGLFFTDVPPLRMPLMLRLGSRTIDIPAGEANYRIDDEFEVPVDIDVLGVYPHAHYLGHAMTGAAMLPDGTRHWLIRIPQWDFNWQDEYRLRRPLPLPKGSRLRMEFTYDNSEANVRNPHHPPRRVVWGPHSTDEMGDLWIQVLPRNPGDWPALKGAFVRKDRQAELAGYQQAVRVDPDDVSARYNLGSLLEQADRLDEAEVQYRHALKVSPDHAQSLNNLGVVLCKRGQLAEAIPLFQRAVELQPDYVDAQENLAQARRLTRQSK